MSIFEVDKQGLARIARRRSLVFILYELWQNAVDTNAKNIEVVLTKIPGRPAAELHVIDDDPDGFKDLSHAYTLFAESEKIRDPNKRGRFNLGEKLVLALCETAEVRSTTGTIIFGDSGRTHSRKKRESGSEFFGIMKMNAKEFEECIEGFWALLPPEGVRTTFNGQELLHRKPVSSFEVQLPTEIADDEGILRPTRRRTAVRIYDVKPGETASLYEMGIPVVETCDTWHVEINQKVPLNTERDNVTPAYLRQVRVAVLNHMHGRLDKEQATASWVREASADEKCSDEAIRSVIKNRFEKAVIFDPSDPEANNQAVVDGFQVIHGGSLSRGEWANVKRSGVILPAGQVTPSRPGAEVPTVYMKESELTWSMGRIRRFVHEISKLILGFQAEVEFTKTENVTYLATWGSKRLRFNVNNLGHAWFKQSNGGFIGSDIIDLVIHEFAHEFCDNHLDRKYHDALSKLGAQFTGAALSRPGLFEVNG